MVYNASDGVRFQQPGSARLGSATAWRNGAAVAGHVGSSWARPRAIVVSTTFSSAMDRQAGTQPNSKTFRTNFEDSDVAWHLRSRIEPWKRSPSASATQTHRFGQPVGTIAADMFKEFTDTFAKI